MRTLLVICTMWIMTAINPDIFSGTSESESVVVIFLFAFFMDIYVSYKKGYFD